LCNITAQNYLHINCEENLLDSEKDFTDRKAKKDDGAGFTRQSRKKLNNLLKQWIYGALKL